MKDLHTLDKYRLTDHERKYYGTVGDGGNGCFKVYVDGRWFFVIASNGGRWNHGEQIRLMLSSYCKGMPYKSSYLYCDTLDACFYYDHDGHTCVTISARWCNGAKDRDKPIKKAFEYVQKMLDAMTAEADQWLRGCRDERN